MTTESTAYEGARDAVEVDRHARALQWIAWPFSVAFIVIAFVARVPTYKWSPVFLVPLLWVVYWLRKRLDVHPVHFLMYAVALLMHDLGAFGWYQKSPLPISWDIAVHFYFGFAGTFLVFRALERYLGLPPWALWVATVLAVMGTGAIHELVEYASYLMLGEEKGMLKPSTSYFFDTQRDLLNNFVGCNLALLLYLGVRVVRRGTARR